MKVVLVGAREDGLAHLILDHLEHHTPHEVVGFLDEVPGEPGRTVFGLPLFGSLSAVEQSIEAGAEGAFVSIGDGHARARIAPVLRGAGLSMVTVVAPGAYVAPSAEVGDGVFVGANAIISSGTQIGDLAVVFSQSVVGHHTTVGEAATLAGGVLLGGRSSVGARTLVGLGAKVMADVVIGNDAVVGAGALVTKNVPEGATVSGIPARSHPPRS